MALMTVMQMMIRTTSPPRMKSLRAQPRNDEACLRNCKSMEWGTDDQDESCK